MARKAQKLMVIMFSLTTLASTLIIGYSLTFYVGVSLAIRSASVSIRDFRIEFVAEDRMMISTNVAVNNTSPYQFSWLWVEENVYVNETRAGTTYETFSESNPLVILPQAETNHTLEIYLQLAFARPEIREWVADPSVTKSWVAIVDVYCRDPFGSTIKLSASASKEIQ